MLFGLVNLGATFQRVMDITFCGLIGQSVVVYLKDVIVLQTQWLDHLRHLNKISKGYRKYEMSLNHRKSIFIVSKGNLLGHIIAKSGIKVD